MKFLPSLEVALKRRWRSKPWLIGLLAVICPPYLLLLSFRQRAKDYWITFLVFIGYIIFYIGTNRNDILNNDYTFEIFWEFFFPALLTSSILGGFFAFVSACNLKVGYEFWFNISERQSDRYAEYKEKKDKANKKNNTKAKSESYKKTIKPKWFSALDENQKEFFDDQRLDTNELIDFLKRYYNACADQTYDTNNVKAENRKNKYYLSNGYHLFFTHLFCSEAGTSKLIEHEIVINALIDNFFEDYNISRNEALVLYYNSIFLANKRQRVSPTLSDLDEILAINNLPEILYEPERGLYINKKTERRKEYQITQFNQGLTLTKERIEKAEKMFNEVMWIQTLEEKQSEEENEDEESINYKVNKDSETFDWSTQLTEEQKAFLDNERSIENETFSEFLERFYNKQVSSKPKSKPTTKTKDIFYRNVGTCSPDDLLLKSDSEIYELVKYQLLHLTRGTRTSEAGEVEYLKGLLKKLRNSSNS